MYLNYRKTQKDIRIFPICLTCTLDVFKQQEMEVLQMHRYKFNFYIRCI